MNAGRSESRVERRRAAAREQILRIAARRFAASGPEGVRLEEIAEEADLARGTLYSHFPSKAKLVEEVLRPALLRAHEEGKRLRALPARQGIDRLLELYVELWRDYRDPLRLAYRTPENSLGSLAKLHQSFLDAVVHTFERAARAGRLRATDPALAARLLSRVAVPLLEVLSERPGGDALFEESVRAMLLREPRKSSRNGSGRPSPGTGQE
jgi:AcrR family transcriptional regulator